MPTEDKIVKIIGGSTPANQVDVVNVGSNYGMVVSEYDPSGNPIAAAINLTGNNFVLQQALGSYPKLLLEYNDNFDDGKMHGWHYHNQFSLSGKRFSPSLSKVSRKGTYSLAMDVPALNSAQCFARKSQGGFALPKGAKKAIFGCDWSWHGAYKYGAFGFTFSMDISDVSGNRKWFKVRWVESADGASYAMKWQYDSSGADIATWTDIAGATETISWNEPYKNTWSRMYFVIDLTNSQLEKVWSNYNSWSLLGLSIGNDTTLADYFNTMNNLLYVENRSTQTGYENSFYVENPFFGYQF